MASPASHHSHHSHDGLEETSERGTLIRDASRSTEGWEKRSDGKWYKTDYYKLLEEQRGEIGIEVLERFYVGSWKVAVNEEWMRQKRISRILVLGAGSGIVSHGGIILRVLEIQEDAIHEYFDEAISLIKEALAEGDSLLMVCKDMRTFCPLVVIAHLMAVMGWSLTVAIERVQAIFKITIAGFALYTLQRWEQIIASRKSVSVKREIISQQAAVEAPKTEVVVAAPAPVIVAAPAPQPVYFAPMWANSWANWGYAAPAISTASVVNPVYAAAAPVISAPEFAPVAAPLSYSVAPASVANVNYSALSSGMALAPSSGVALAPYTGGYSYGGLGGFGGYTGLGYSGFTGYNGLAGYNGFSGLSTGYTGLSTGLGYSGLSTAGYGLSTAGFGGYSGGFAASSGAVGQVASAGVASGMAAGVSHQQRTGQVQVQTTTVSSGAQLLRGSASWHSGGVVVRPQHH